MEIKGWDAIARRLQRLADRAPSAGAEALAPEAAEILRHARNNCPVDTGELRDSGQVVEVENETGAEAAVVFSAPHAAIVHELHRTQPRFLAKAVDTARPGMETRLGERMKPWLERA